MRPKNRRGVRWYELVDSPGYVSNVAWRDFQRSIRKILGDQPLPDGLSSEEYLSVKVNRLRRYSDFLETQLQQTPAPIKQTDAGLDAVSEIAKLPITPEILVVSNLVWESLIREFAQSPSKIRAISHRAFEELIAHLFERFGYSVELTSQTRDGGRDIIAIKQTEVNAKYLIECKHPETDKKIGIAPVRELFAVKVDEKATKAILATTSYLTRDAELFVERHKWELEVQDFDGVMKWVKAYAK
jgi:restriction system protein